MGKSPRSIRLLRHILFHAATGNSIAKGQVQQRQLALPLEDTWRSPAPAHPPSHENRPCSARQQQPHSGQSHSQTPLTSFTSTRSTTYPAPLPYWQAVLNRVKRIMGAPSLRMLFRARMGNHEPRTCRVSLFMLALWHHRQPCRERLPIPPDHPVHKRLFLPDRHLLLQRVDHPPARVKRRSPVC